MDEVKRNLVDVSKNIAVTLKKGEVLDLELVKVSALCRISHALEKLILDTEAQKRKLIQFELENNTLIAENKKLKRQKAALKGHLNREK